MDYDGRNLENGFIVDNKVFVVDEGGVDNFFNNTGIYPTSSIFVHVGFVHRTVLSINDDSTKNPENF